MLTFSLGASAASSVMTGAGCESLFDQAEMTVSDLVFYMLIQTLLRSLTLILAIPWCARSTTLPHSLLGMTVHLPFSIRPSVPSLNSSHLPELYHCFLVLVNQADAKTFSHCFWCYASLTLYRVVSAAVSLSSSCIVRALGHASYVIIFRKLSVQRSL